MVVTSDVMNQTKVRAWFPHPFEQLRIPGFFDLYTVISNPLCSQGRVLLAESKDIVGACGLIVQIKWPDNRIEFFWKSVKEW